ncbi:MAG: glycogen/starch/alpha-glucan phosphorylase [Oscillospiraceae bacterium]|nr:glycogen/starch/alpha-glucan phosphorylase [Oscillospiraceae bacterium]
MKSPFTKEELKKQLEGILEYDFRTDSKNATDAQLYRALSSIVVNYLKEKRHNFMREVNSQGKKQVYYLSMEFLMGRSLKTSLYNLGMEKEAEAAFSDWGIKLDRIFEEEPDAGLGNGGLGRLAACYLDGLATCDYPATGYSIRYEYGIFKQKIVDGWQTELPDNWLPGGGAWLVPNPDQAVEVHFDGHINEYWDENYHHLEHVDYTTVNAVPYDMYVSGYDSKGVSKLRLWSAENMSFDMGSFNSGDYAKALGASNIAHSISKVLYPNDNHMEGKALRLRQQYFMCAASVGDIVMRHMKVYGTLENFHEKVAIHINDTHPTLAVPELMRILLDDCGYGWEQAWHIVTNAFAYTNHTVMAEALEKWDVPLIEKILPRIFSIICEINRRYCEELFNRTQNSEKVTKMSIIQDNKIHMANLCVAASHSVNGVSKLHSQIIKDDVFNLQATDKPSQFKNVTNGIAYRRWLLQSNQGLTELLSECIGEGFKKDASELIKFQVFANDKAVLEKLGKIKRANKERFAKYVESTTGTKLNVDSIFDVQVKRLHEYKRQQLNALNIIADYNYLKQNPDAPFTPKTYIFAAKAAPGYYIAKQIIKMIWCIGEEIKHDPKLREKLQVVFLEDYRVTLSEMLMPAAEVSEQISLAGTEASGTGNMKFMLNGALTVGTYDGANVEIHEAVGDDNIFVFGMRTPEVNELRIRGYHPEQYINNSQTIKDAMQRMYNGINGATFEEVANSIKFKDFYMALADFDSYRGTQQYISEVYKNAEEWNRKSLFNIAGAGRFSADRAVTDYARDIWNLK